jgi:hypothetical protein
MSAVRIALFLVCLSAPASADLVPAPIPTPSAPSAPGPRADPSPSFGSPPAGFEQLQADFERGAAQLRESQSALRRNLLELLSPAQRALVASTIGELATNPEPDVISATRRIDAALSPAQAAAIIRLVNAEAARRQAMFLQMAQQQMPPLARQLPAAAPPLAGEVPATHQSATIQAHSAFGVGGATMFMGVAPGQSAGTTLLRVLTSPGTSPLGPTPVIVRGSLLPAPSIGP